MSRRYQGGVLSATGVTPDGIYAKGIWTTTSQAQYKAAGTWPTVLVPGQAYGGGYFAGQISTSGDGVATHNLVVCDRTVGQSSSLRFKTTNTDDPGATSVIDGPSNSASMNDASHPAAQFCEAINSGGYTDWYMPAKNELEVLYYFLKPSTTNNTAGFGANTNAVLPEPYNTNYSSGSPARTSNTAFYETTGSQRFEVSIYNSSTQSSATATWSQTFSTGQQYSSQDKNNSLYVRAVRRVPL